MNKPIGFKSLTQLKQNLWIKDGIKLGLRWFYLQHEFLKHTTIEDMNKQKKQKQYHELFNQIYN